MQHYTLLWDSALVWQLTVLQVSNFENVSSAGCFSAEDKIALELAD